MTMQKKKIKSSHNKKRNTAFLFEALVKELSKAVVSDDERKKKAVSKIIKEHFSKGSILYKELSLYRQLYESNDLNQADAERILQEVRRVYAGLAQPNIFAAQSKLISQVNKTVTPKVFGNFVPNYKAIATIAQIFDDKVPIKSRVILEGKMIRQMSSPKNQSVLKTPAVNTTTLKIFAKKFNETYGHLHEEQRTLLFKYINSVSDGGLQLKVFLNEEIPRLKEELTKAKVVEEIESDKSMVKKTDKVIETLDGFKGQFMTEDVLKKVLKIQDLVREISIDADS